MKCFIAALVLGLAMCGPLAAQTKGGAIAEVVLGFGMLADFDPGLTGVRGERAHALGSVGVRLASVTRTEALRFSADLRDVQDLGEQSDVSLSYVRDSRSSKLEATVRDRRLPSGAVDFDQTFGSAGEASLGFDLSALAVAVHVTDSGVRLQTGLNRPIGVDLNAYRSTRVNGATDSKREGLGARLNLRQSDRTLVYTQLRQDAFKASGPVKVDETALRVTAGTEHDLNRRVSIAAHVGWRQVETMRTGVVSTHDGLEWGIGAQKKGPTSNLTGRFAQTQTGQGRLSELRFGLEQNMKTGALHVWLGAAKLQHGPQEMIAGLAYRHDLANGLFRAEIDRGFAASDETAELRVVTRAMASLRQDLGLNGQLEMSLNYLDVAATTTTSEREARRIRASYHHQLKRDWGVVAGAQRRERNDVSQRKVSSNSVFLTFQRRFSGGL